MKIKGFLPHADQRRAIDLIEKGDEKFIILTTGRQWGKSLLGINLILKWALTQNGSSNLWVSPVYSQAKKVFETINQSIAGTPVVESINKSELEIRFMNKSKIIFRSGEREDTLRGYTLDNLVVDEAAFIKDDVWNQVLRQTVMVKGKKVLFISTPKGKNFLYNLYLRGLDDTQQSYLSIKGTSYDTPFISEEELQEAKETLSDDIFRQELLGEFIDNGGEVFNNIDRYCIIPEWRQKQTGVQYYAGLDLARTQDYSVLTIMDENGNVCYIYRDRQKAWNTIVDEVIKIIKRYDASLLVEVNNIGDVIYEQIKKQYPKTYPFVTTNASKQNIIEDLIYAFNQNSITLPNQDLFSPLYQELKAFTFTYSPRTRQIKYEGQGGYHDDCVMSLAITYNCLKQKKTQGTYYVY